MQVKSIKGKKTIISKVSTNREKPEFQSTNLLARIWNFIKNNPAFIMLAGLIILGGLTSPVFLTYQNLINTLWIASVLGILSLGQGLLLITGNSDMSVAWTVGLAGIASVLAQRAGANLPTSIAIGLVNGLIIILTKASSFLITLGTSLLIYSVSLTITKSKTFYAELPEFNLLGTGKLFGVIHYSTLIFISLAIILEIILRKTPFGRSLYIIGLNRRSGELSGIKPNRIIILCFVVAGVLAALSGLIITSRNISTVANSGAGMEFLSLIACVLGGTRLGGGKGGTLRTVIGVLVIGVLNNLLILLNIPYEGQSIAKGLVFIVVVWADNIFQKR
jgi:ribose transport system permease protein